MPHGLQIYLSVCAIWAFRTSVLCQSFQFDCILSLLARILLRGQHFGDLCRPVSMWAVVLFGIISDIPTPILYIALVAEVLYPTLGDDDDECYVIADTTTEPMHPGYAGGKQLLETPVSMTADGLCLYHCIVAAERVVVLEAIRQTRIHPKMLNPNSAKKELGFQTTEAFRNHEARV